MDNNLDHINDPAVPKITSWAQFQILMASGRYTEDDPLNVTFMTRIDCAMCGPIWECGGMVWEDTGETVVPAAADRIGKVGTMYLPEGQQFFLVDDARQYLRDHLDDAHPGWRFVIDGDHDHIRARRCGRKSRR